MKTYKIASIAGDGIGLEVVPPSLKILKEIAKKHDFEIKFDEFDFSSCDYFEKHGKMLPDNWKELIGKHDAIFLVLLGCQIEFQITFLCGVQLLLLEENLISMLI